MDADLALPDLGLLWFAGLPLEELMGVSESVCGVSWGLGSYGGFCGPSRWLIMALCAADEITGLLGDSPAMDSFLSAVLFPDMFSEIFGPS